MRNLIIHMARFIKLKKLQKLLINIKRYCEKNPTYQISTGLPTQAPPIITLLTEKSILNLQAFLFPIFDNYGIDVVITGHDHFYTRTYPLQGDNIVKQTVDASGKVVYPNATVYFTLNSASGSKYYDLTPVPENYSAVRAQLKVPPSPMSASTAPLLLFIPIVPIP
jgi:predicted MPP superfamily phosphohydrolase